MSVAKILVVEDEGLTAMEIQRKLQVWGYEVPSFAFSGKEAVIKAEKIKPDLILMDVILKGEGDGIDAATEIKKRLDIPIIYLTAFGDDETRERAQITDPADYILKPYEENELHQKIQNAINQHKIDKKLIENGEWLDKKLKDSGVIILDSKGVIRYINDYGCELLLSDKEKIINSKLGSIFPIKITDYDGDLENYLNKFVDEDGAGISQQTVFIRDNHEVCLEYSFTPIRNDQGKLVGVNLIFEDVSKQMEEEKTLLQNLQRFKSIYSNSQVATQIFNFDGELLEANEKCLELFGAKDVNDLAKFNLFRDFKLKPEEIESLRKGHKFEYETKFTFDDLDILKEYTPSKSGSISLEVIISSLDSHDTTNEYLVQYHNITKHRILEEKLKMNESFYRSVVDDQNEVICRFAPDGKLTFANESYRRYFGQKDGFDSIFSLSEKDKEKMMVHMKSFNIDEPFKIFEGYIEMPDGDLRWWQWVTKAIFDSEGNISEYQSVGHDITLHYKKEKDLQNELENRRTELKNKNSEYENIKNSLESEISKRKEKEKELEKSREEVKEKEKALEKSSEDLKEKLMENSSKLDKTIKDLKKELSEHIENEKSLKEKLEKVNNELKIKTEEYDSYKNDLDENLSSQKAAKEKLQETCKELDKKLHESSEKYTKDRDDLENEIANLKKSTDSLEKIKTELENELAEITENEKKTRKALENKEKILKNIYKRIKTNVKTISTLNNLQYDYIMDQMLTKFHDSRSHHLSIGLVHEKLYESEDQENIDFQGYLESLLEDISRSQGSNKVNIGINANKICLDMENTVTCGLIISELVTNSLKHAFPGNRDGEISVKSSLEHNNIIIDVSDNGVGMPSKVDIKNSETFGLQLVKTFVDEADGDIELKSGEGTSYVITIPQNR